MKEKQILYIYDSLCGWCYGFGPVIKRLYQTYHEQIPFTVLSGGMVLGDQEAPIGKMAAFLERAIPQVEQTTGVKFGEAYRQGILQEGSYRSSSFMPSIGMSLFKQYLPEQAVLFAHDLQRAFYLYGESLNEPETYLALAQKYGLPGEQFVRQMGTTEMVRMAQQDFALVAELGISGFPAIVYQNGDDYYMLSQGYRSFEELQPVFDKVIKVKAG